jgi:hypothetical protein
MPSRYPQAILVSCEIPWDDSERLVENVFRDEVRKTLELGFHNLYIFGTAGEGYAVDTTRFRRIVDIFYEETGAPEARPQVGVIGLSTANILERLEYAYETGFRDLLQRRLRRLAGSEIFALQSASREAGFNRRGLPTHRGRNAEPGGYQEHGNDD